MRRRAPLSVRRPLPLLALATLAACSVADGDQPASRMLGRSTGASAARMTIAGDRVVAIASPLDYRELPRAARTTCEALAPDGELTFCGAERGPRGDGFRVEKRYTDPPHTQSVLTDADGRVLERWHTVPVPDVPQHVLSTALQIGPQVDVARIVSGPIEEECWRIEVHNRRGERFVVQVDLAGALQWSRRRQQCSVDS